MKTALLISTYNWPDALQLVLDSVLVQTLPPNEILIADDGSDSKTKKVIDDFISKSSVSVKHFWQEDIGFRKSIILNKTIAFTNSEYIIQVDGDCILHPNFVEDHTAFANRGFYLYGSRVNIKQPFATEILMKRIKIFNVFSKQIKNKTRTLHSPFLINFFKGKLGVPDKFRGCNFSFWRDDFIAVNGYNEDMTGWGREDSELIIRLTNNNVKGRRLRYRGIVYHIWHKINSKARLTINDSIQQEAINKKIIFCSNGVAKYINKEFFTD